MANYNIKSGEELSTRSFLIWRIVQTLVWLVGAAILFFLIFYPNVGIHLFWNILIPIAPALLVVATGIWRNVCPMGTTSLLPRHFGFSKRKKLSVKQTGILNLIAIIALFVIVPLRHTIFDTNGLATAILIISLGLIAIILGFFYEWKSTWCSGLCPVHPVEKLYGMNNKLALPNAHCNQCFRCVTPCPDSTPGINPNSAKKTNYHKISVFLMVAAFPGFIWGWFQVPDYNGITSIEQITSVYLLPLIGSFSTSILYLILSRFFKTKFLVGLFSSAAVSCYYWFRLPALFGYGIFPGDGMLIDLTGVLPELSITVLTLFTTIFFFWWILLRKNSKISWAKRPAYANKQKHIKKHLQNV